MSRNGAVSIITRLRAGRPGFDSRQLLGFFFFSPLSLYRLWGLLTLLSNGYRGSFPGREADHTSLSSAEVKNIWSYTSTSPYVLIAWYLVKYRDIFIFTFTLQHFTGSLCLFGDKF